MLHLDGLGVADVEAPHGHGRLGVAAWEIHVRGPRHACHVPGARHNGRDQTVIGNYQENTQVVYDLDRDVLPFAPAQFDKLVASVIVYKGRTLY